jgi:hypothetical protein
LFGGWRTAWACSEEADLVYPLLFRQATVSAEEAGCKPVETKSISIMIQFFDVDALVFFKTNLISC